MNDEQVKALLSALSEGDGDSPPISNVGQIARLQEELEHLKTYKGWQIGQIVHARRGASMKGHGKPHIVVAVKDRYYHWVGEPGSNQYGEAVDTRVASIQSDRVYYHWTDGALLELWKEGEG